MEMKAIFKEKETTELDITEMADAHCHLDLMDQSSIGKCIKAGVMTMITDGIDTKSNAMAIELSDGKHVFAALGIDPEHALNIGDEELEFRRVLFRSCSFRYLTFLQPYIPVWKQRLCSRKGRPPTS